MPNTLRVLPRSSATTEVDMERDLDLWRALCYFRSVKLERARSFEGPHDERSTSRVGDPMVCVSMWLLLLVLAF